MENVKIHREGDKWTIHVGVDLHPIEKSQLEHLMKKYKEIFAWLPIDMLKIDISMACHKLSIDLSIKLF